MKKKIPTLKVFHLGEPDFYGQTNTVMSSLYEVKTFERSNWAIIQCHLRGGGKVTLRPATDKEMLWAHKKMVAIKQRQADGHWG